MELILEVNIFLLVFVLVGRLSTLKWTSQVSLARLLPQLNILTWTTTKLRKMNRTAVVTTLRTWEPLCVAVMEKCVKLLCFCIALYGMVLGRGDQCW